MKKIIYVVISVSVVLLVLTLTACITKTTWNEPGYKEKALSEYCHAIPNFGSRPHFEDECIADNQNLSAKEVCIISCSNPWEHTFQPSFLIEIICKKKCRNE